MCARHTCLPARPPPWLCRFCEMVATSGLAGAVLMTYAMALIGVVFYVPPLRNIARR